jgi:5-formyltetrahydrofolate cyclo-ligase
LVPLIAFDKKGFRVGYGKGFYDRFITRCHPGVITVGLSFFEPVDAIDDLTEFDVPMKYCVTPNNLYTF